MYVGSPAEDDELTMTVDGGVGISDALDVVGEIPCMAPDHAGIGKCSGGTGGFFTARSQTDHYSYDHAGPVAARS